MGIITPQNFVLSHSGKMYYAYSGKRGSGAEAALNVDLFNIGLNLFRHGLARARRRGIWRVNCFNR